jgi:hypothetical protein
MNIRIHSRVRRGDVYGVVTRIAGSIAAVTWNDGSTGYAGIATLVPAPFAVTLAEALAFVQRAKATGAHSVAVPMDVLDALVAGCRVSG